MNLHISSINLYHASLYQNYINTIPGCSEALKDGATKTAYRKKFL